MIENISVVITTIVFIISGLNFLVGDEGNRRATILTMKAWDWVDNLQKSIRSGVLRPWISGNRIQFIVLLLLSIILTIFSSLWFGDAAELVYFELRENPIVVPSSICVLLLPFITSVFVPQMTRIRLIGLSLAVVIALFAILELAIYTVPKLSSYNILGIKGTWDGLGLLFFAVVVTCTSSVIVFAFLLTNLTVIMTLFLVKLVVWIAEAFLRRTAEYPKGPIMVVSGLLAATLTYLKIWK